MRAHLTWDRPLFSLLAVAVGTGALGLASVESEESASDLAVMVEMIAVNRESLTDLLRSKGNDDEKRHQLDTWMKEERAELGECLYLRVAGGKAGKLSSVQELIYGTEGDPPEIPNEWIVEGDYQGRPPITQSAYAAFEVRELGTVLEVRGQVEEEAPGFLSVEPILSVSELKERQGVLAGPREPDPNPMSGKWQPLIQSSEIDHPLRLVDGRCHLVGTMAHATDPSMQWVVFLTAWDLDQPR